MIPRAQFIGGHWAHPSKAETEHSWYNVTTWAQRVWDAARNALMSEWALDRFDESKRENITRRMAVAREDYRRRILTWYRQLCIPMLPGKCTPNSVAELMAESWDLGELQSITSRARTARGTSAGRISRSRPHRPGFLQSSRSKP